MSQNSTYDHTQTIVMMRTLSPSTVFIFADSLDVGCVPFKYCQFLFLKYANQILQALHIISESYASISCAARTVDNNKEKQLILMPGF